MQTGSEKDRTRHNGKSASVELSLSKYRRKILKRVFFAISAIAFSYIAAWLFYFSQSKELSPSSFRIRLLASAHMSGVTQGHEMPNLFDVYINAGSIILKARLSQVPEPEREFPSGPNPNYYWEYRDFSPNVKGLPPKTSLKSLIGRTLSARIPIRLFRAKNLKAWRIHLLVNIEGNEIKGISDEKGNINIQLTKEKLGLGESKMNPNLVTLIIGLAGIIATLIASSLGLYFTAKARSAPFREMLYSKQIQLIIQIIHKQSRFHIFATLLVGDDSTYKDQAREDIRICLKDYSELTEKAAAILPTDLWVEIKQLSSYMTKLVVNYDENGKLEGEDIKKLSAKGAKVGLISRAILGVDELSDESIKLFSSTDNIERLAKIEAEELVNLAEEADD